MLNIPALEQLKQDIAREELIFGMKYILELPLDQGKPATFGEAITWGATCCMIALTLAQNEEMLGRTVERYTRMSNSAKTPEMYITGFNSFVEAQAMLGLTEAQADRLFHRSEWPEEFKNIADNEGERPAAIKLIQRIIENGSAEFLFDEDRVRYSQSVYEE